MKTKLNILIISLLTIVSLCSAQDITDNYNVFSNYNETEETPKNIDTYTFSTTYRIEAGYSQDWQYSQSTSYADTYLHGTKIGFTVDFNLPYHLSIQTGLQYQFTYGKNEQHWSGLDVEYTTEEYLQHNLFKQTLIVPVYATYTQKLWKDLSLYFYTGPQFAVGVAQKDKIKNNLSDATLAWLESNDIPTQTYDRYTDKELRRFNIQWSLGGGIQWAKYRLYSGYNFGLNNLVKSDADYLSDSHLWEWNWFVSFSYAF